MPQMPQMQNKQKQFNEQFNQQFEQQQRSQYQQMPHQHQHQQHQHQQQQQRSDYDTRSRTNFDNQSLYSNIGRSLDTQSIRSNGQMRQPMMPDMFKSQNRIY
jgi:G3E family GTPase